MMSEEKAWTNKGFIYLVVALSSQHNNNVETLITIFSWNLVNFLHSIFREKLFRHERANIFVESGNSNPSGSRSF